MFGRKAMQIQIDTLRRELEEERAAKARVESKLRVTEIAHNASLDKLNDDHEAELAHFQESYDRRTGSYKREAAHWQKSYREVLIELETARAEALRHDGELFIHEGINVEVRRERRHNQMRWVARCMTHDVELVETADHATLELVLESHRQRRRAVIVPSALTTYVAETAAFNNEETARIQSEDEG